MTTSKHHCNKCSKATNGKEYRNGFCFECWETQEAFKDNITRQELSRRGGGIEISLDFLGYPGGKMSAYQNYLGGGLLGAIQSDCNIAPDWETDSKLAEMSKQLKRYLHELTNPDTEWEGRDFEQNQNMPVSAY